MSDTPETDAAADWYLGASCSTDPDDRTVPLAVSRKLERERDEAQAALEGAKTIAKTIAAEMLVNVKDIEKERDKAREDATNYYARIGELESERDEARKLASALHEDQTKLILERDAAREQLATAKAERNAAHLKCHRIAEEIMAWLTDPQPNNTTPPATSK
jgi:uncharacterized coiled-coil DUF342 family protein